MSEISEIIEREISYWIAKNHNYKKYFEKRKLSNMIMGCEGILKNNSLKDKIVTDFIKGFALIGQAGVQKTDEYDAEIDKLLKPLLDIIIERVDSADYQKQIFDAAITGKEILQVNGVTTLLNMEELLLQKGREKAILLTPADVGALKTRLIEYKHNQHQAKPQIKPPKALKPFEEYFAPGYRKTLPRALKEKFAGKKNKAIRLMIEVLKGKGLIEVIEGDNAELFRAIKKYFGEEIGTYNSTFISYKFNPDYSSKNDFQTTTIIIEKILNSI